MRTRLLVLPAAGILLISAAAPASAAVTVTVGGYVDGDAANDVISVSCTGGVLTANGATAGDSCATLTQLRVDPGAGSDSVYLGDLTTAALPGLHEVHVNTDELAGPAAADTVNGSPLNEWMTGDFSDTLNGGGGSDLLDGANSASGGDGDDTLMNISSIASGGNGDDRFVQFVATGGLDGGPGTDSWDLDFDQSILAQAIAGLSFSLSQTHLVFDVAGDPLPPQTVPANGLEQVYVTLLRVGPQSWDGSAFAGHQNIRGLAGPDTVTGGPGEDALYGGTDGDTVTGGAGSDLLHGGDGNDLVNARDGVSDRVDCGSGSDTVVADASDVVTGCESVQLPAVPVPPAPPAVAPNTGAISGKGKVTKPLVAKFRFTSPSAGATFQCKVDKAAWKSCTSPYKVKTRTLKLGKHTLRVRAVLAGVADATPSVKTFRVVR